MSGRCAFSVVLNAHLPFVREYKAPVRRIPTVFDENGVQVPAQPGRGGVAYPLDVNLSPGSAEESWFFEAVSETYLPLLAVFDRLERDRVPFRVGIVLSPVLAQMLGDELLLKKYTAHLDNQIEFGKQELDRLRDNDETGPLAQYCFDIAVERRAFFGVRCDGNVFQVFDKFRRKGNIEFLAAPATPFFLPFHCQYPETVRAQIEVALSHYRYLLGINPQGFWLPELGWVKEIDSFLRSYGFTYTITESHGLIFGSPPPSRGTFFPVRTPRGLYVMARDFNAYGEVAGMAKKGPYRDNGRDRGYELPAEMIGDFLAQNGARCQTGYKYWREGGLYEPAAACAAAEEQAVVFLEDNRIRLERASLHMKEMPLCLCACSADTFGRDWHEGPVFLESLFRRAAENSNFVFTTPQEYLNLYDYSSFEVSTPEFSSSGENGYAETWLDSSNDWIYRHLSRSIERMIELAERFSEDSGLKERALNQAARELLLAQAADWPAFLYRQECTGYARHQLESALRNFTTIYEALGSNYISTEWLTNLERHHNIFPNINYRVFRRKR